MLLCIHAGTYVLCDVCLLLLCVLRLSKVLKLRLVERSSLVSTSLSLSTTKFLVSKLKFLLGTS